MLDFPVYLRYTTLVFDEKELTMGTNYYAEINDEDQTELHIGKSSSGWAFNLRQHPVIDINSFYDWLRILSQNNVVIRDEYGMQLEMKEMVNKIMNRKRYMVIDMMTQRDLDLNSAIIDSRYNLLRTNEVRRWGEGTWDYCNYEFC